MITSLSVSESRTLSGHRDSVVCLDTNPGDHMLLCSGSDDSTIRLWDIRTLKTITCFTSCFDGKAIEAVKFSVKDPNILFSCSGRSIYTFDIRREGIIQKESLSTLIIPREESEIEEENIGCLSIHPSGEWIAVGEDSGIISIIPLETSQIPVFITKSRSRIRKLSKYHNSIIGSVAFNPNSARELISGSFDCNLSVWDISLSRPQATFNYSTDIQNALSEKKGTNTPTTNIFNPPFVQSVEYALGGRVIITALGNGSLGVHSSSNITLSSFVEAHSAMATSLHISDHIAISGGADKHLKLWRIDEIISEKEIISKKKEKKGKNKTIIKKIMSTDALEVHSIGGIKHHQKINAISSSHDVNLMLSSYFAVGDTSNKISLYSFIQ